MPTQFKHTALLDLTFYICMPLHPTARVLAIKKWTNSFYITCPFPIHNNNRFIMVLHLVRIRSAYKDLKICSFYHAHICTHTHTHTTHTHTYTRRHIRTPHPPHLDVHVVPVPQMGQPHSVQSQAAWDEGFTFLRLTTPAQSSGSTV